MGIRSTQVGLRWFQALGKPPQTKRQINGATFARINSNADILRECPENRAASATAPSTLIFSLAAKRERLRLVILRGRNVGGTPMRMMILFGTIALSAALGVGAAYADMVALCGHGL